MKLGLAFGLKAVDLVDGKPLNFTAFPFDHEGGEVMCDGDDGRPLGQRIIQDQTQPHRPCLEAFDLLLVQFFPQLATFAAIGIDDTLGKRNAGSRTTPVRAQ